MYILSHVLCFGDTPGRMRCCHVFILVDLCEVFFFFFQAEDGIRDLTVTGVQTCALPISRRDARRRARQRPGGSRERARAGRACGAQRDAMTAPRLRPGLVVVEQVYRGESSYIVKDSESHKYFRFRPVELIVMQEFDGERTTAQIAAALAAQGLPFGPAAVEAFAANLRHLGVVDRSLAA